MFTDLLRTFSLWPIWLRLGLQDVRVRFRRSSLGVVWVFLNLFITVTAIGLVYGYLLNQTLTTFLPFLTVGIVVWNYLTTSVTEGGSAFIVSEGYIRQIGLPIYIYIFRSFVSVTVIALFGLGAYFPVAFFSGISFTLGVLWVVPGFLLVAIVSLLSIALFAYLHTRFRDTVPFASSLLQVAFYVTPVMWPPETLRKHDLSWVVDCNPLYHLLEVVRRPLLHAEPATLFNYLTVGALIAGLSLVTGSCLWWYKKRIVYFL